MWYRKQLRLVRRARRAARAQQHWMLALELEGLTAITLHTHSRQLTIPIERAAAGQLVDTLREALRDRRRAWKQEARQLRQDWRESQRLRKRPMPPQALTQWVYYPEPTPSLPSKAGNSVYPFYSYGIAAQQPFICFS